MTMLLESAGKISLREETPPAYRTPVLKVMQGGRAKPRPRFAIDVDSTLYSFETPAREAFQKLYEETEDREYLKGLYHSWDEWRSPADACGIDIWMKVISMCHAPEVIAQQVPFAGAAATLQGLASQGYGLTYISTRSPESAEATKQWLEKWEFPLGETAQIHCMMDDKQSYISECQYLIDDRPKTLIEFVYDSSWDVSQGKRKGLSIMYPYNRALTDIPDIFLSPTWAGLSSWLVRRELLPQPTHVPLEVPHGVG